MKRTTLALAALCLPLIASAQTITIDTRAEGIPVQETMYGMFFEDINYGADGGLYAELVKNRSFEFDNPLAGWKTFGKFEVRDDGPFERCPHYVRLRYAGHPVMFSGIENEGYFGMGIKEGEQYRFSVWARTAPYAKKSKAAATEHITFHLCDDDTMEESQMFYDETIEISGSEWKKYEVVFTSPRTIQDATLRIVLESWNEDELREDCCVDLEHISLFPVDTYNGDSNGLRKDIAQTLAELKPGVLRFPGGCIVEGTTLDQRYQWKNSVGPVENRPTNMNRWNYTFDYRMFPDYYQSYGLGFYEFFRFAEEIGAEPLPVISCGMACQFQNDPEDHPDADLKELQPYIDDALD
ncbi:MAG: carbohydrate binding domain-containing protein, partial [Bacteroidia bacterium]|nr:carbohydrate binding domain-containing protein [Bacteroidia bacterium]